jgi:leukotriene A-4 hydrolase/aminopeptidase
MARLDPHSYADTDQGVITDADLNLTVDFQQHRLHGHVRLSLTGASGGSLDLDTRTLQIEKVEGPGGELAFEIGEPDEVLGQRLRIQLPEGTESITVHYATTPEASALQWLEPANTAGKQHPYMFSQCQPHHCRSMMPIQDSAQVRFRYKAAITVPEPLVAVMSAAPGESKPGPVAGTVTHTCEMPQPIPAYLLALAVGNISSRDLGPRSRVYTEPEMLDEAAWEFDAVDSMLLKAEALFGEYRWDRYDFLVMPPAFPYGGMENPRLTFLTPSLLAKDRSLVNVLAHELAHSWTGNLVTNASMNDFWLNEGFTVWAERRILEALEGTEAVALSAALGREALQEALNNFGEGSPYSKLKNDLEGVDPDEVYSSVPYEKGFLFVALLEKTVGREKFDAFILDYMDRFNFTSITTEQFLEFLEEKLPGIFEQVGGQEWIYESGVPANAPVFASARLTELQALAAGWEDGKRPDVAAAKTWPVEELLVYLGGLPKSVSHEDCQWLEQNFEFNSSENAEILHKWLMLAAGSAYEPAYDKIRAFLGRFGRMKYLKPLYKTLGENEATRSVGLSIFEEHKGLYHSIARAGLESILEL